MAVKRRHNIANGVASIFVLGCGIAFCVMVGCLVKKMRKFELHGDLERELHEQFHRDARGHEHRSHHHGWEHKGWEHKGFDHRFRDGGEHRPHHYAMCWTFGFAFIVTAILGIVSAFVKRRGVYIAQMVLGIITLLVKGTLFAFAIYGLKAMSRMNISEEECRSVGDKCVCDNLRTYNFSCESAFKVYHMVLGIMAVVVVGWVFTLVSTILAGILGCGKQEETKSEKPALSPYMTPVVVQSGGLPPKPGFEPETHDHANLVANMECEKK